MNLKNLHKHSLAIATAICVLRLLSPVLAQPDLSSLERAHQDGTATTSQRLLLAKLWIAVDRPQEALQLLNGLTPAGGAEEQARALLIGSANEALNRPGEARKTYDDLLTAVPDDPAILLRFGAFEYRIGDLVKARRLLEQALQRSPASAECLYYLFTIENRSEYLSRLVAVDGPDGHWSARALAAASP